VIFPAVAAAVGASIEANDIDIKISISSAATQQIGSGYVSKDL
jgi:hypothetical protein